MTVTSDEQSPLTSAQVTSARRAIHLWQRAEHQNIEQRICSQPITSMYGYAGTLPSGVKSLDNFLWSRLVWGDHLPMKVGRDAAHHVMCSGYNGYWLLYRVRIRKFHRDFAYPR